MDPYSSMVQLKLTLIENVICWERNSKRKKIFQLDIAKLLSVADTKQAFFEDSTHK